MTVRAESLWEVAGTDFYEIEAVFHHIECR